MFVSKYVYVLIDGNWRSTDLPLGSNEVFLLRALTIILLGNEAK